SVIISSALLATGAFLSEYKDIKETLQSLLEDLESVVEWLFESGLRNRVRVHSNLKLDPRFRQELEAHKKMKKIKLGLTASLIAIAAAIGIVAFGENEHKSSGAVKEVVPTNGIRTAESRTVITCAHCDGKGTCRAEKNQLSCHVCKQSAH